MACLRLWTSIGPRAGLSAAVANACRPYVESAIELFGPHRCMFESNFPVDKRTCSYQVLWNAFKRLASGCSTTEKAFLFKERRSVSIGFPVFEAHGPPGWRATK